MKLCFLKIDRIIQKVNRHIIEIPAGGIRFDFQDKEISLGEPLKLEVDSNGEFINQVRYVDFEIYSGQTIAPEIKRMKWSVLSLITHEDFERAIQLELGTGTIYHVPGTDLLEMEMTT